MAYCEPSDSFLVSMYNQYWLHSRHVEDGRLKILASYFVVVGIVIYALYGHDVLDKKQELRIMLISFEIIVSLLFLLMNIKMEYVINMYIRSTNRILEAAHVDERIYGRAHYLDSGKGIRGISISRVFVILYSLCLCLFLGLLVYERCPSLLMASVIVLSVLWITVSILIYFDVMLKGTRVP